MDARAVGFLHKRLVNHDIAKLDRVLRLGLIVQNFNFGKLANDEGHHVIHKMVKHGQTVGCVGPRPFVALQQCILQTFVALQCRIELLSLDDMLCTTGEHGKTECRAKSKGMQRCLWDVTM